MSLLQVGRYPPKTRASSGNSGPRIRHVKCDERKPGCLRCENFGCKCDGYVGGNKRRQQAVQLVFRPKILPGFQPIFYQPTSVNFQNKQEHEYFRLFSSSMARQLSGHPKCNFWSSSILQACESDSSIRDAVIALAALKKSAESKHSSDNWTVEEKREAQIHHRFALKSYSKAVKSMRDAALSGRQELRTTLISCLVIISFESFHGDHEAAAKQIGIGLDLVKNHMTRPLGSKIEHELISSFRQLEIQAQSFGQSRPKEDHQILARVGQSTVDSMPSEFHDFQEAFFYFEVIQSRLFHFMAAVLVLDPHGCMNLDNSSSIRVEDLPERDKYLAEFQRWHTACEPYLKQAQASQDHELLFTAAVIELLYFTSYVVTVMVRDSDHAYSETRGLMPLFSRMLALVKSVLKYSDDYEGISTFKISMQIVCPLYSIARRCPHRGTRKEAISLLLSHPRREGLWDSTLAGRLSEWIMLLEEDNYEGEYIPEHLRCTGTSMLDCDMVGRRAQVIGKIPSRDGMRLIQKKEVIYW